LFRQPDDQITFWLFLLSHEPKAAVSAPQGASYLSVQPSRGPAGTIVAQMPGLSAAAALALETAATGGAVVLEDAL